LKGAPITAGFIDALFMRANHDEKQVMIEVLESLMASLEGPTEWGHAGKVFRFAGDYARALECHEQALKLVVETEGRDSAAYADLSYSMSSTLDKAGRYEEAIQHCQEALRVEVLLYGPDSEEVAGTYYRMGWILNMQNKREEAIEWMLKALAIEEKTLGLWHKSTAGTLGGLCSAYRGAGQLEKAMEYAQRGHAIEERIYPKGASTLGPNHYNMGRILLEMGKPEEALAQFLEGAAIFEASVGPKHRNTLRNRTFIGMALTACGRREEARTHLQETLQWQREGQVRPSDLHVTEEALAQLS
jgi:tetratricopeptide (TPR) repeat protein